ncbi:hypothetical protein PHLCEN_2v8613 [Hermanssonia centrifuga]|uniref:Uncharacterized protein n=1 Tax=Hermanssonia centrifuga TaxID=98765 RepID=A0A2R6NT82_9APHY|nr:hypothetical protein PHLCEN_2v8613 [Hermanssonia centrifuga]
MILRRITGLSKLALISWSKELQRRLVAEDIPIIVTSLNPGGVHTDGNKAFAAQQNFVVKNLFLLLSYSAFPSPTKGAYPSIIAAASPEVRANSKAYMGAYLEPSGKIGKSNSPTADCCNEELSQELWTTTEGILKDIGVLEGDHLQIVQN